MEEIQLCLRNWGQETRLGTDQVQERALVGLQGHYGGRAGGRHGYMLDSHRLAPHPELTFGFFGEVVGQEGR